MAKWLSTPEVLAFYEGRDKSYSIEDIIKKFGPRARRKEEVIPCIIAYKQQPIGYIQYYPTDPKDYDIEGIDVGEQYKKIIAMDLFIGETSYWNKGLGTIVIQEMVRYLLSEEGAESIWIDPVTTNERAIRCYEKSGFRKVGIVPKREMHEGVYRDSYIMAVQKNKLSNVPQEAIEALHVLERLLEDQLIGIYLYGSAILGGLHVNSDVDILVLCKQSLSEEIRGELTKELMLISGKVGCRNKRHLEVTLINKKAIIPWQFPPKYEYMYGEWLREELESGIIPQANEDSDGAILLWQARQHSYTLKGPKITEVTPVIPVSDVQIAIGSCLPHLVYGIKGDERNVILTLARMCF